MPWRRRRGVATSVAAALSTALSTALLGACGGAIQAPAAAPETSAPAAAADLAAPAPPAPPAGVADPVAAAPAPPTRLSPELAFAPPLVVDPSLAPDGRLLAWRVSDDRTALRVRHVDGVGDGLAVPAAGEVAGEVLTWAWGADGRRLWVVRRLPDGLSIEAVELRAALPDGRTAGTGVEVTSVRPLLVAEDGEPEIVTVAAGPPEEALVALRRPDDDTHVVFAVPADGRRPVERARGGADVERWLADGAGEPRAAVVAPGDGSWRLVRVAGGRLAEPLLACGAEETCRALALDGAGTRLALATDHAGSPRVELAFLDLAQGAFRRAPRPPEDDAAPLRRDLGGALLAADGTLLATWPTGEPFRLDPHDPVFAADWQRLAPALPPTVVELLGASADRRRLLARAAGAVLLLDLDRGEAREVLRLRPERDAARRPPRRAVRYAARDGLPIPAMLTLPPDADSRGPLPAVVLPPDDPWRPRRGGEQPLVELLADRGFAVLQPSPRGSAGFGRAFRAAGERQWGGAMLDDLADGVGWMVAEGIAEPERVAIVGFGWGGYAAVAALAFTPDLYAAGVAVDGPVDLEAMVAAAADPLQAAVLRRRAGDPAIWEQRERLRRHSPLAHAGAIRAPLLRVDVEGGGWSDPDGSARLVAALRRLGRPVESFSVVGSGGRLDGAAGVAVAREVERFLALHLGTAGDG